MNHRSLLARATEGTDAPTPGYLYIDLAKAATGNPAACQDMAKYLSNRLASRQNPNIKFKCCKVIAKLCDQVPRNAFRRFIAQDHESISAIKESMNFRGTIDPVLGDEPNQRVRVAAKEALDAVYREAPASEMPSGGGSGGGYGVGVSSSYGPSPHSGGGPNSAGVGGGGIGGRRMEGIGNPRFSDPRLDPRYNPDMPRGIQGMVKEASEVISGMIKDPLARNIPDPVVIRQGHSGSLPGYPNNSNGGGYNSSYGRPPPGQSDLARQTGGQWTMASNRGPGAVTTEYERNSSTQQYSNSSPAARSGGVGGSWGAAPTQQSHATPSITINTIPGATSGTLGSSAVSDGTYERNLVLELCPAGGMKPVPPPDKLASFARACPTLNSDLICPVLLDCLEEGQPWIIRAKSLCVMETCISSGTRLSDGVNPYRDFFHACQDEIVPLTSHARAAIRDPARRVLQLLGIAFDSSATVAAPISAPPHQQPTAEAPNLLDFDDDLPPVAPAPAAMPPPPPTEAPPVPQASPTANDMFGGMQLKSSAPSATAAPTPAVASPAPPAPSMSLLDFDTPVESSPAPTTAILTNTNDIFGSHSATSTDGSVAVTPATTLFDQLNLNGTKTAIDTSLTAAPSTFGGGSAFGFINSGSDGIAGGSLADTPAKPVFDPLKTGNTPNSAGQQKKTMQLSAEQMQAMAFQQMMMQQQYQQMQMAAMQQQAGFSPAGMVVPMHPPIANSGNHMMNQQMAMNMRFTPGGVAPVGVGVTGGFSFMNAPKTAQKDDKKFDFVKDAMFSAKK